MKSAGLAVIALLLIGLSFSQYNSTGGNVTQINFNNNLPSGSWDGIYGDVVFGTGLNYTHTVTGNNVSLINIVAQDPGCAVSSITTTIIAVNASGLALPLSAGSLPQLDAFVSGAESASAAFNLTRSFTIMNSTISGAPSLYTYANNSVSPDFLEGYLNDAAGNLVLVAVVVSDKPDWNGTTSDYQMMLPRGAAPMSYTIFTDVAYACVPPGPPPPPPSGNLYHVLYIDPAGPFQVRAGGTFAAPFTVVNRGDYVESNIALTLTCPASFSCGSGAISRLALHGQNTTSVPITVDGAGEYVLRICARDSHTFYCRDFIVDVLPQCGSDADCVPGQYCSGGACNDKKKPGENCTDPSQCGSGVCSGGICAYCTKDTDCAEGETCAGGSCTRFQCRCGVVSGHACVAYACCADADCGKCEACSGNACVKKQSGILVISGQMMEGDYARVQVVDSLGKGVAGARVFTHSSSTYADGNGFATIAIPYSGIIYASADCYPQVGILLNITRIGYIITNPDIFVGQETNITVVDSQGNPIPLTTIYVENSVVTTDEHGRFNFTFYTPGTKVFRGTKEGFRLENADVNVQPRPGSCGFPIWLNLFSFVPSDLYILWIFSLILSTLDLLIISRRQGKLPAFVKFGYAYGLLVLALPGVGIFSICFVSNVVLLQFLITLLMLLRGYGEPKEWFRYEPERRETVKG